MKPLPRNPEAMMRLKTFETLRGDPPEARRQLAEEARVVGDAVEIDSNFEVVTAMPLAWRKKQIGDGLPAVGVSIVVDVVTASGRDGIEEVGTRAVGIEFRAVFVEG